MPNFIDYDMTTVRRAYADLKQRKTEARRELELMLPDGFDRPERRERCEYARGQAAAYDITIDMFLDIFGPTLEEGS